MDIIDPGHQYRLLSLDGPLDQRLTFVKRNTPPEKYPGNVDAYPGTNLQDVLRVCLDRLAYLDGQQAATENVWAARAIKEAIFALEVRAHRRHGRVLADSADPDDVARAAACSVCGHVYCTWCTPKGA